MPIYEYTCEECPSQFERVVLNGNTVIECPDCGSRRSTSSTKC